MDKKFVTTTYQLKKCLSNGPQTGSLRFVFVSDLHNMELGAHNKNLLQAIRSQEPDAVLIGGDTMVAKPGVPMDAALEFIKNAAAEFPVYYANGNHECRLRIYPEVYGDMYERFLEVVEKAGVYHLVNESAYLSIRGIPVVIHGFEADREYYHRFEDKVMEVSEVEQNLGTPEAGYYHILLAHNPAYKDAYFRWGADLTLSGHCHGGVVRLGEHCGLISPNMKLFYGFCHGKFKDSSGRCMIVSAGLGEHTVPVRIHNPRELVILEIDFDGK